MEWTELMTKYKKEHPNCEICGKPVQGMAHHIQSRGAGGCDSEYNLITLCMLHHTEAHGGQKTFAIVYKIKKIRDNFRSRGKWTRVDEDKYQDVN